MNLDVKKSHIDVIHFRKAVKKRLHEKTDSLAIVYLFPPRGL